MKKIPFFSLLLFIFILYSCEYQSDEVYNRTVNKDVPPPQIQVVELNIEEDTIFVYQSRDIKFHFQSDNQEITMVRFLVDGEAIGIVYSDYGHFELPVWFIDNGLHDFSIEIYTGAGTGSLADELGIEGYLSSRTWKLLIENDYSPLITKTIKNGLLYLKWNAYHGSDFKEYIISKWGPNYNEYEITRTTTNEFIDSSYVGEQAGYYVSVKTQVGILFIDDLYLPADLPVMHFTAGDSNKYLVKWNRTKYYNAVDSYVLFQGSETDYECIRQVKSTDNINDTIYQVTGAVFGDLARFRLRVVPKNTNVLYNPATYSFFESRVQDEIGFFFLSPNNYPNPYYLKVDSDEFIYYSCDTLTRYSLSQRRAVEKLHYPDGCNFCYENVMASNSGKFIASYVGCNRDILLAKGSDFQQISVHKLQDITDGQQYGMAVSDAGIAVIDNKNGGLSLYNLATSTPLGIYPKSLIGDYHQSVKISPTGEYFFLRADTCRLVQFKNGIFTDVWKSQTTGIEYCDFNSQNPNQLVLWNGSKLSIRLCNDFSLVTEFALNDEGLLDIDYINGEILMYSPGHLYVRSLSDGSLVKDVPINFNPYSWSENCHLISHTIICGRGLLYFI